MAKKTTLEEIRARHSRIVKMISMGMCSVNCAGAVHTDGNCFCHCGGLNHGALWIDEIVAEYD